MNSYEIVLVNDFAHINGGAGQVALTSAMALAERGHSVTVFSAVAPVMAELKKKKIKLICTRQHQIRSDPNRFRAVRQGIWNVKAARRMQVLLKDLDPSRTIVHIHGWTKSLSSSVVPVAVGNGFHVVVTMHDYFLACPNGGFFHYRKNRVCRLRPLSPACLTSNCDKDGIPQKLWRICRQVVQKRWGEIPGGIGHYIAISDFSRSILEPYLPKHARVYHVPNPIFVDKRDPALPGENKAFVFVGRLDPEKGPLLFAQAAARAKVKTLFIGDGFCREKIREIAPRAAITGWLSPMRVKSTLSKARALVFPSLWYEPYGLVVLEAAALGIPAIVSDTSAACQAIEDGVTGFVFRSGDVDDLTKKIQQLCDAETAARMGRTAYNRYWSNPTTIEHHVRQLEKVYASILSSEVKTTPVAMRSP
jgi:glycosyltransferase involved in cell wall biosynthesis